MYWYHLHKIQSNTLDHIRAKDFTWQSPVPVPCLILSTPHLAEDERWQKAVEEQMWIDASAQVGLVEVRCSTARTNHPWSLVSFDFTHLIGVASGVSSGNVT